MTDVFTGKAEHTIDAKGRVFIPAMYRVELGNTFVVAKGFSEPYLSIYPMSEWEALIAKIDAIGMDQQTRHIKRYIMINSTQTEMDAQGRIILSKEYREFANLSKNILLLGMGKTIEVWDAEAITEQMSEQPDSLESILAMLS